MTAVIEKPQEIKGYTNAPWWRGNARLKDLSGKLLGASIIAQSSLIVFWAVSGTSPLSLLGPLRNTERGNLYGFLSAGGLVVILTVCLAIYRAASFNREWRSDFPTYATVNPDVPNVSSKLLAAGINLRSLF